MELIGKKLHLEQMKTLYDRPFTPESLSEDFDVRGGEWVAEKGWLTGKNPANAPGMIISRSEFFGDIMLDFKARTIPPSTHDICVMWNGSWNESDNKRDVAYVTGIAGWWRGKVGIEKSPEYKLYAATQIFPFEPGRIYHIQTGSVQGHIFVIIDDRIVLETTDPSPIDGTKYGKIGFEAYCSNIQFTDFSVKRIAWEVLSLTYEREF